MFYLSHTCQNPFHTNQHRPTASSGTGTRLNPSLCNSLDALVSLCLSLPSLSSSHLDLQWSRAWVASQEVFSGEGWAAPPIEPGQVSACRGIVYKDTPALPAPPITLASWFVYEFIHTSGFMRKRESVKRLRAVPMSLNSSKCCFFSNLPLHNVPRNVDVLQRSACLMYLLERFMLYVKTLCRKSPD